MTTLDCSHAMGAAESGYEVSVAFDYRCCARTCGVSVSARGVSLSARGVSLSARGVSLSSSLGHALFSAAFSALAFALAGGDERHVLRDAVRLRNLRRAVARVLARVAGGEDRLLVAHHARPRLKGGRSSCTSVQLQVPEGAAGVRVAPPSKIQSPSDISRQMSASERGALVSRAWFNLNGTQFRAPRAAPTS